MTPEEAHAALVAARDLFANGRWQDLTTTLDPVYRAEALQGTEQGEVAFYLGEGHLGIEQPAAAVPFLEAAVGLADVDFSSWAQEELTRARHLAGGGGHTDPAGTGDEQHAAHGPDVSGHPELRRDSTQYDWVAHAQAKLEHLAYYGGRVDGWFGPVTEDAVKRFQEYWGQPADGIIGQATWAALETAAPGVTGTPQAHHGTGQHGQAAPVEEPVVQFADDPIGGNPGAPQQHWNPQTPDLSGVPGPDPEAPVEHGTVALGAEFEIALKAPVNTGYGPVKVKDLQLKLSGKLTGGKADAVGITGSGPMKNTVKIETAKWEMLELGGDWVATLKGSADVNSSGGVGAVIEVTNGSATFEAKFSIIKFDKGELSVSELSITGGAKFENKPIEIAGETFYFSGKAVFGPTLVPNVEWFVQQGLITGGEAAATTAAAGAGATAGETTIATGAGAVGAGELIITTGFVAIAIAQLYVAYANITDQQALKQMQDDAPKAVDDFAAGFVSAWGAGGAPSGFWGSTGATAGQRQFEADIQAFKVHIEAEARKPERTDLAGLVVDDAFLDSVREQWRSQAAGKADAFRAVVEAMYGKMVRTAVVQAFLKAHPTSSLGGDHVRDSYVYGGLYDAKPVAAPDTQAGYAAARNANMQVNIDQWQKEWEAQYGN